MEVNVYNLDGSVKGKLKLSKVFDSEYRPRLILRAVNSSASSRTQPKGTMPGAGRLYTAEYCGIRHHPRQLVGKSIARKRRLKNQRSLIQGNVAGIPGTVGGPNAHPPKVEKVIAEKINKKERKLALQSAIASLTNKELVKARGHKFDEKLTLPVVVDDKFETVDKTKSIVDFMKKVGLYKDVERAKAKKTVRAGKGKARGRKYKTAKSIIFVTSKEGCGLEKAVRNIEGVDVISFRNLSVESIAPAGKSARLAVFVEGAEKKL
jgi:large subunit ribosomal protein L4e